MKDTRVYKILEEKQINMELIENNLEKVIELSKKYPHIIELDINPLFANLNEAKVADARIVLDN